MAKKTPLQHVREICLALPDTKETPTWGEPHFRVGEKIFAGCSEHDRRWSAGFKLEKDHAAELVSDDERFEVAPYVGRHGWVSMDVTDVKDWEEVRELIVESYLLIAPARTRSKLEGGGLGPSGEREGGRKKTKKSVARNARTRPSRKARPER